MSSGDAALLTLTGAGVLYWALGVALCRVRLGSWYPMQHTGTYGDDRVRRDTARFVGNDFQRWGFAYALATVVALPLPDGLALALAVAGLLSLTVTLGLRGVAFARRRLHHYRMLDDALARAEGGDEPGSTGNAA